MKLVSTLLLLTASLYGYALKTSAIELSDVSNALYQMDMAVLSAKYNILMAGESVKKLGE